MDAKRILIVEDESIVALEIECRLQELGFDVVAVVSSGEDAVQKAAESEPDLILMDIMIQGDLDGIEATQQILKNKPLPIIFLTAHSDTATIARAKKTAPYGYLVKPFDEHELSSAIETAFQVLENEKTQT